MLAASKLANPMFWAVFIAWVFTVVLHEFAHGLVACRGGDYTIKERGGLSLNPLRYVDPVGSLLLPAVFLLLGGVPLPGGVTYIRRDLLRGPGWESAVAAAGPVTNLLLFLLLVLPLHPAVGWVDPSAGPEGWSGLQQLLAALAVLQMLAVVLNLVPVPPLDGFQILAPLMDPDVRERVSKPPVSTALCVGFFIVVVALPGFRERLFSLTTQVLDLLGFDYGSHEFFRRSYNICVAAEDP